MKTINYPQNNPYIVYYKDMYIKKSKSNMIVGEYKWIVMSKYNNVPLILNYYNTYKRAKQTLQHYRDDIHKINIVKDDECLASHMPGGAIYDNYFKD